MRAIYTLLKDLPGIKEGSTLLVAGEHCSFHEIGKEEFGTKVDKDIKEIIRIIRENPDLFEYWVENPELVELSKMKVSDRWYAVLSNIGKNVS